MHIFHCWHCTKENWERVAHNGFVHLMGHIDKCCKCDAVELVDFHF